MSTVTMTNRTTATALHHSPNVEATCHHALSSRSPSPPRHATSPPFSPTSRKLGTTIADRASTLYPTWSEFAGSLLLHMCRGSLIATAVAFTVHQPVQVLHDVVADATGIDDNAFFFTVAVCAIHTTLYVVLCSFFAACDHFQWLQEHKLPRTPRMLPSVEKMKRTLLEAAFHQLLVGPLAMYGVYHLVGGVPSVHTPLGNSMFEVWKHFILAEVFYETGFYAFHRTVHESTFLYKLIHKKHHSYIGTVSIASEHTNVFEAVLLPTVGYCLYNRVHIVILLTYVTWRYFETYELHSGYCFKNTRLSKMGLLHAHRTEFHDFHHTYNVGTFGVFPSCGLDVVFRSMDHYLVHLEEKKGTNTNDKKQIDQRAF